MSNDLPESFGNFLLYQTEDGRSRVECRFQDETLWLSQALLAELFDTSPQNITLHLKALYEEREINNPKINRIVYRLFALTPAKIALIEALFAE